MQATHTLAIATCLAFALVACKEAPPPSDNTAMATPEATTMTREAPAMTSPIASPALPGPVASDATPAPQSEPPAAATSDSQRPTGDDTTQAKSTSIDSPATNPRGSLTKEDEINAMPLAGHGNNHSSPSLESPQKQ